MACTLSEGNGENKKGKKNQTPSEAEKHQASRGAFQRSSQFVYEMIPQVEGDVLMPFFGNARLIDARLNLNGLLQLLTTRPGCYNGRNITECCEKKKQID